MNVFLIVGFHYLTIDMENRTKIYEKHICNIDFRDVDYRFRGNFLRKFEPRKNIFHAVKSMLSFVIRLLYGRCLDNAFLIMHVLIMNVTGKIRFVDAFKYRNCKCKFLQKKIIAALSLFIWNCNSVKFCFKINKEKCYDSCLENDNNLTPDDLKWTGKIN